MKTFILIGIFTGLAGFIFDYTARKLYEGKGIKEKLWSIRQLLNIFVYGTGGSLVFLVYKIPLFHNTVWSIVFYFIGGLICCLVELGYGYLFNIKLKLKMWDYDQSITIFGKKIKLNILRQTDLLHLFLWSVLSILIVNFNWIIENLAK